MSLALLCGVGSVFGFVVLWITLKHDGIDRSFCPLIHRVGPVILTHYAAVECSRATEIAGMAREIWAHPTLKGAFPKETSQEFEFEVIFDPKKDPGYRPWGTSRAVVNLSGAELYLAYPGQDVGTRSFKGTIAEELHHVCRFLRQGDEKQIFKFNWEDGNDGVLLYYTLNPPELEALRFVVEVTGDRANLLKEVEGYLERRVGSTVRILQ